MSRETLNRWRLLLGASADEALAETGDYAQETFAYRELDEALGYLYDREYGEEQGYQGRSGGRGGGRGGSSLTVPGWLGRVRKLFPRETVEILEKQALDRYGLSELLADKKVLESLEPNINLLKNILQFKSRMKGEVVASAKEIVRRVVEDLRRKLESEVREQISGKRNRYADGRVRSLRSLNMKKTISRNLKNYDRDNRRFVVDRLYFDGRVQPYNKWHVVIAVDESGSMLDSVIYSAVMASIFYRLNALKTSLFVFDTEVVDFSGRLEDPVDVLMSVQLGGGTHIAKALRYGETLIENPGRTLFILVSDLEEGYPAQHMYRAAKDILDGGSRLLALTALNFEGHPVYDERAARTFADMGAEVAALTPDALAEWIGRIVN
ncbi:VWA domain-containing protein [Saccharibacillus sp. CPCC 101409]|uniref:VWA domain-containing protein n=1 Tax=Saccharibacillus sp. CPCC 101409 TaxID=3058041 RepID=UPI002672200C|nr:VWA domain-containing protein [Saccharibacillus sp. CPCC 101409]MDO3411418.1 VWA domain-containing protein [Saccharibacillus sp. CPCC 101409]